MRTRTSAHRVAGVSLLSAITSRPIAPSALVDGKNSPTSPLNEDGGWMSSCAATRLGVTSSRPGERFPRESEFSRLLRRRWASSASRMLSGEPSSGVRRQRSPGHQRQLRLAGFVPLVRLQFRDPTCAGRCTLRADGCAHIGRRSTSLEPARGATRSWMPLRQSSTRVFIARSSLRGPHSCLTTWGGGCR